MITSELDLGTVIGNFAEANDINEHVGSYAVKDGTQPYPYWESQSSVAARGETIPGEVVFHASAEERYVIKSTVRKPVSNKYFGDGGWEWVAGDQGTELGAKLIILMGELNA